jgi:hypothetical protein
LCIKPVKFKLPHRRIDHGESRFALGPLLEVLVVILPLDIGVLRFEGFIHTDKRPMHQNVPVEISPGHFANPGLDCVEATVKLLGRVCRLCGSDTGPCCKSTSCQVGTDDGGGIRCRKVPQFAVFLDLL